MSAGTPPEIGMVNNIAAQFGHLPAARAAEAVMNHVLRFWDPRMRSRLLTLAAGGTEDLEPVARAAVDLVRGHTWSVAPTTAKHGDAVSVRTADGWLEVDVAAPQARLALRNALGVRELVEGQEPAGGLPIAQVRAAIEQVSMQWSTAEVLLALEQEDVRPRRSNVDPGFVAP